MSSIHKNCICSSIPYLDKNPVVIDIGCNINPIIEINYAPLIYGWNDDFTALFLEEYPDGKCIGIEPLHWQTYEDKWKNDFRVELLKIGVSDKDCVETLFCPGDRHVLSSLYFRNDFKNDENVKTKQIQCKKLDTIFVDLKLEKIDYLKIDTEGSEFKILRGAEKLLKEKKIFFIQFEYGLSELDDNIPSFQKISNFLRSFDYEEFLTIDGESLWKVN